MSLLADEFGRRGNARISDQEVTDIGASFGPDVERMGTAAAQLVFAGWGWMFREQPIGDFGIDAHVEPRVAKNRMSGRLIALQFKSGRSYLERAEGGWLYRGDYKHVRYWLGHVLPVVIVFYDPDNGVLRWQRIADEFVRYTEKAWTLFVPDGQVLEVS